MDGDQVCESELAREAVGAAERLRGERGQVVDVARLTLPEQRLEERIGEDAVVEVLLEAVQGGLAAGVLEETGHADTG